jgi:nucleotide-binding universal stress UspA family protein
MASCGKDEDGVRKIGVAMDYSASSKRALEWAIRNLLRRGDTLVVLVVQHSSGDEAKRAALWAKSGSRKLAHSPASTNPHSHPSAAPLLVSCGYVSELTD